MKPRPRVSLLLFVIVIGPAWSGCGDPPGIVPVAPPGMELQRVPPPTVGSGAEALGERPAGGSHTDHVATSSTISEPTKIGETKKTTSGLVYETVKEGTGPAAKPGQTVTVNYIGRLSDGTKFDSSADRGSPSVIKIGVSGALKGWDEGIPGMKVGEKRRLALPSELAYGTKGFPPSVPGNANVVYEIDLLDVK